MMIERKSRWWTQPRTIHEVYIATYALSIIILIISLRLAYNKPASDLIIFGLALVSAVLAILAIVQGQFASTALERTVGSLQDNAKEINAAAMSISNIKDEIIGRLQSYGDRLDEISNQTANIKTPGSSDHATPKSGNGTIEEIRRFFLSRCSNAGLAVMLTGLTFCLRNKTFNLNEFSVFTAMSREYYMGVIVASASSNMIEFRSGSTYDSCEITSGLITALEMLTELRRRLSEPNRLDLTQLNVLVGKVDEYTHNHLPASERIRV